MAALEAMTEETIRCAGMQRIRKSSANSWCRGISSSQDAAEMNCA